MQQAQQGSGHGSRSGEYQACMGSTKHAWEPIGERVVSDDGSSARGCVFVCVCVCVWVGVCVWVCGVKILTGDVDHAQREPPGSLGGPCPGG